MVGAIRYLHNDFEFEILVRFKKTQSIFDFRF